MEMELETNSYEDEEFENEEEREEEKEKRAREKEPLVYNDQGIAVISVEVKSKKQVLGTVDVEQFRDVNSAIRFFDEKTKNHGAEVVLGMINASHRVKQTNDFRNEKTKKVSPLTILRKKLKGGDEEAQAKFRALCEELGI